MKSRGFCASRWSRTFHHKCFRAFFPGRKVPFAACSNLCRRSLASFSACRANTCKRSQVASAMLYTAWYNSGCSRFTSATRSSKLETWQSDVAPTFRSASAGLKAGATSANPNLACRSPKKAASISRSCRAKSSARRGSGSRFPACINTLSKFDFASVICVGGSQKPGARSRL